MNNVLFDHFRGWRKGPVGKNLLLFPSTQIQLTAAVGDPMSPLKVARARTQVALTFKTEY